MVTSPKNLNVIHPKHLVKTYGHSIISINTSHIAVLLRWTVITLLSKISVKLVHSKTTLALKSMGNINVTQQYMYTILIKIDSII